MQSTIPAAALASLHREVAVALSGMGAATSRIAAHYVLGARPGDLAAVETLRTAARDIVMRSPGSAGELLEAFHDDRAARAAPINALAVLSRADEIGGAQGDSLASARRIATRYRVDPNMRRLCQTVVPVAGLLAQLGGTMTEIEYRAVSRLGAVDEDEATALLVSADRFTNTPTSIALAPQERAHLIGRFGIFGLRLANALLRAGRASSSRQLSEELRRRSGLDDLRKELTTHFTMRRDVLKARSTLLAIGELSRRHPTPGSAELSESVERVTAGAHELAELRLVTAVRSGAVKLDEDEIVEIERLVGAVGGSVCERLGLPPDTPTEVQKKEALVAHARWAARAENPLTQATGVHAAQIVQRSYESLIMQLM